MLKKPCIICGAIFCKPYYCSKKEWENRKLCSKKCVYVYLSQSCSGDKSPLYKGGTVSTQGYRILNINGKRIAEHRFVMENYLGRKLLRNEIVHHLDGEKLNNNINNLILFPSVNIHSKEHYPKGSLLGANNNKQFEWSRNFPSCAECGDNASKHEGHGICHNCASRKYNKTDKRKQYMKKYLKEHASKILNLGHNSATTR